PIYMGKGFSSFGNDGKSVEPYLVERIINRESENIYEAKTLQYEVFTPQVAWYMTEILQRAVSEGTGKAGEYSKALAGKTGTTEHPRVEGKIKDAWFVGYTPKYVSALWMGYDVSDEDHYLTGGSSYPTELTKAIFSEMDKEVSLGDEFVKPEYVQSLPEQIKLEEVNDLKVSYTYGGFPFVKCKLTWESENENRVIYHIYEQTEDGSKLIGETPGSNREYIIDKVPLLKRGRYYIVPFDPNTNQEGPPSDIVELSL